MSETLISNEQYAVPVNERTLIDVDLINDNRSPDGSFDELFLAESRQNYYSAVIEIGMQYSIATTEHPVAYIQEEERLRRTFMSLGKTAVQAAESGFMFHVHESALARVPVEVSEARDHEENLMPGKTKVAISPRISPKDGDYEEAKAENLADQDAIRITRAKVDEQGEVVARQMESILVRDVPLNAWVALLKDPNNIFGRAVVVEDEESALAVMKTHAELEIPDDQLPGGPIDILREVYRYITDDEASRRVAMHIQNFEIRDHEDLTRKAYNIATRWQRFDIALADSLREGVATGEIQAFVYRFQDMWNEEDLDLIDERQLTDGRIIMDRRLAARIAHARQNTLLTTAGVLSRDEEVIAQMDPKIVVSVLEKEDAVQIFQDAGASYDQFFALEYESALLIATQNVQIGGGCAGDRDGNFRRDGDFEGLINTILEGGGSTGWNSYSSKDKKQGLCRIAACSSRPNKVELGPCSICRVCQFKFDRGDDPTRHVNTKLKLENIFILPGLERALKTKSGEEFVFKITNLSKYHKAKSDRTSFQLAA